MSSVFVTFPDQQWRDLAGELPDGVEAGWWDLTGPPPRPHVDYVVLPYGATDRLSALEGVSAGLVQSFSVGYDGVADVLPTGHRFANGADTHETATAELALTLVLAAQRNLADYARAVAERRWEDLERSPGLADQRVLLLGHGGIGRRIARQLEAFDATVVRVARTARVEDEGIVHGLDELADLLPDADVVIASLPLDASTRGLVDATVLALLRAGALFVNVGRGATVDTAALLAELRSGRIRAALDVIDPEPLPPDHEAWTVPGLLLTPHVGGFSEAGPRRVAALLRDQLARLADGREPRNVVLDRRAVRVGS